MLNHRPIFLNCFSRGGSNILWNLLLSHPQVCSPMRETLEIFYFGLRARTWPGLWVRVLSRQPRLFDQWHLQPRRPLTGAAARYLDRVLYRYKLTTLDDEDMSIKAPGQTYTRDEVEASRLVAKNNNGLTFLTERLLEVYPDATFFALVRHPVALYESHRRRGISPGPDAFAPFYNRLAQRMLDDADRFDACHLLRFEQLVHEPLASVDEIYHHAGLERGAVERLRFKCKPHLQPDGSHSTPYDQNSHRWFAPDEVPAFLEPSIDRLQAERVDASEAARVLELTAEVRQALGYSDAPEA